MSRMSPVDVSSSNRSAALVPVVAFTAVVVAACLNPINGSLIVTAYPKIASSFQIRYSVVSSLVMYFLAATAAIQPIAGILGDLFGCKRIFMLGIFGFCCASCMAAFSETYDSLVMWRIIQAIFSGTITANSATLIHRVIPEKSISTYLGYLNAAMVGSTALAFPLGGLLIQYFEWSALFWCSVPFGLLSLVLVSMFVPKDRGSEAKFSSFSLIGIPFIPLVYMLQKIIQGEAYVVPAITFILVFVLVVGFVSSSEKAKSHLKDIASVDFVSGCAISFFSAATIFSLMFMFPNWIPSVLEISPVKTGAYLSILTISMMLFSPYCGKLLDAKGERVVIYISQICIVLASFLLIYCLTKVSFVFAMVSMGVGLAITQIISQRAALLSAPKAAQALAMGVFSTMRSGGSIFGNALSAFMYSICAADSIRAGNLLMVWIVAVFLFPILIIFFIRIHRSST